MCVCCTCSGILKIEVLLWCMIWASWLCVSAQQCCFRARRCSFIEQCHVAQLGNSFCTVIPDLLCGSDLFSIEKLEVLNAHTKACCFQFWKNYMLHVLCWRMLAVVDGLCVYAMYATCQRSVHVLVAKAVLSNSFATL